MCSPVWPDCYCTPILAVPLTWPFPITGVDFLLTSSEQVLQLMALEMNSQLCLETCGLFESMSQAVGVPAGESSRPLVETMLRRAQCHLMEGKHVLVIGAGGVSKKFVWEAARAYGLKVRCGNRAPRCPAQPPPSAMEWS